MVPSVIFLKQSNLLTQFKKIHIADQEIFRKVLLRLKQSNYPLGYWFMNSDEKKKQWGVVWDYTEDNTAAKYHSLRQNRDSSQTAASM